MLENSTALPAATSQYTVPRSSRSPGRKLRRQAPWSRAERGWCGITGRRWLPGTTRRQPLPRCVSCSGSQIDTRRSQAP